MKLNLLVVLIILTISHSCKSEKEKLFTKIEKNGSYFIKQNSNEVNIDSISLIKIDTISNKSELFMTYKYLNSKYKDMVDILDDKKNKSEDLIKDMKLYSMIESKDLVDISSDDFKKNKKEFKIYMDSANYYDNKLTHIEKLITSKPDSIKANFYSGSFRIKSFSKDKSINIDTINVFFDLQANPIKGNRFDQIIKTKYKIK